MFVKKTWNLMHRMGLTTVSDQLKELKGIFLA